MWTVPSAVRVYPRAETATTAATQLLSPVPQIHQQQPLGSHLSPLGPWPRILLLPDSLLGTCILMLLYSAVNRQAASWYHSY